MTASAKKGNNPKKWEALLSFLDEKLQLGLLDHLKRVNSYHFEDSLLIIEPGSEKDQEYLSRSTVLQHLEILANEATGIEKLRIKPVGEE